MDFEILLIGSDINCYYMARNCYEAYSKKAYAIGRQAMNFTSYSDILNISIEPNLQDNNVFKKVLKSFALNHKNKKLILIGTNDNYVRMIIENKKFLKKYYLINDISVDLLNNLLIKDNFYNKYKSSNIDLPETYIYDISTELDIKKVNDLKFPLIIKPSDGVCYHNHEFLNQAKVYKLYSKEEVINTIEEIKKSGYLGNLIIQKFIKGNDSYLFDCVFFCDHTKKVKLMTFAQIGLQEHTKTGIGNCTVLVNGYSSLQNYNETIDKLKNFIESLNYQGFGEVDLKYDADDNKYKVLEINPRQARSSYYLTYAGYNIIEYIVNDLLYQKEIDYNLIDKKVCLTFVSKSVIKKYVLDKKLKQEILNLYKKKLVVNPLYYKADNSIKRRIWLFLRKINYILKYKKNQW